MPDFKKFNAYLFEKDELFLPAPHLSGGGRRKSIQKTMTFASKDIFFFE